MDEMTLAVEGMTCDHCVRTVSGSVTDVPGVRTVAVDLETQTVRVTGAAEEAAVREAIVEAGYKVVD